MALSPIPVPEDEWEEFAKTLRDPNYRLPTTTRPSRYVINLTPYFDVTPTVNVRPFTFDGIASIYINPTVENVREIVMHCNNITIQSLSVSMNNVSIALEKNTFECEMANSFLKIPTNDSLQMGQEYVVNITYTGNFQTNMRGFYRSQYRDTNGQRYFSKLLQNSISLLSANSLVKTLLYSSDFAKFFAYTQGTVLAIAFF